MSSLFDMETHLLAADSAGANAAAERGDPEMARRLRGAVEIAMAACHAAMAKNGERP